MSLIPIDEVVFFDVTTHDAATGAVTDADSAPTYDVFEESTDTPILDDQTMTKRTSLTGNYRGSFTASAANGFEAGKWYALVVSATVDGIAAKHVAKNFRMGPAESVAGVPKVDVSHNGGQAISQTSGRQEVNVTHWNGSSVAAPAVAGVPKVDITHISGDSTAADNAEAYFDGTGYAGTNNVIPAVTSVTNQVTANVTAIAGDSGAADNLEAALDGTGSVTITANLAGNVTGNVSGSVGSVTGAVGSVTGNVGGNVTGNVGGNVVGSVGSVTTVSDKTGYRLSATGVDDVWDEAMSGHTTAGSFGDKFRVTASATLKALVTTGSSATSIVLNGSTGIEGAAPSATNDFYNGRVIIFITGTLAGQATDITDYVGATTTLTVTALTGTPADGDTAVIV